MLSNDELSDGIIFILKLRDASGEPVQWAQKLSGDAARHWFGIYRRGDWEALKGQAAAVFCSPIGERDVERIIRAQRCVVISPSGLSAEQIVAVPAEAT